MFSYCPSPTYPESRSFPKINIFNHSLKIKYSFRIPNSQSTSSKTLSLTRLTTLCHSIQHNSADCGALHRRISQSGHRSSKRRTSTAIPSKSTFHSDEIRIFNHTQKFNLISIFAIDEVFQTCNITFEYLRSIGIISSDFPAENTAERIFPFVKQYRTPSCNQESVLYLGLNCLIHAADTDPDFPFSQHWNNDFVTFLLLYVTRSHPLNILCVN
jgi:hypothetical protein